MDFQFETKHFIVNAEERIGPIMDLETFCIIETNWAFVQRSAKFMCKVNERDKLHLELFSSFLPKLYFTQQNSIVPCSITKI